MTNSRNTVTCPGNLLIVLVAILFTQYASAADITTVAYRTVLELGREAGDSLSLPTDVAISENGDIYVVDSGNHRVVVFDASGRRIGQFGEAGTGDGQLRDPVGIDVSANGVVYVADRGNTRIVKFFPDGSSPVSIPLQENGEDVVPIDIAVSSSAAQLFVTTNNSHRVLVFSDTGQLLRGWGGEGDAAGQFRYPATLDVTEDAVFVVDVLNARIQTFDFDGGSNSVFGKLGAGPGTFFRPKGVTVDASGRVYVTDSYLGVIQVFSTDGKFLYAIGNDGVPTRFENPVGLASFGTRIVVIQMLPHTVVILEPEQEPEA